MVDEPISVLDLADQLGKRKQAIFKVLARLNIQTSKQRSASRKGQFIAYVSAEDAQRVIASLNARSELSAQASDRRQAELSVSDSEIGFFYLIALEPQHDVGRFKVGFATVLSERIQKHRCSAPLLELVKYWPCKRLWEKTAIDAAAFDCERLHTEVFRTTSIATVAERCDRFFSAMPAVEQRGL
jgi:hypothetical protein